jgi:hypothetical protein
MKTTHTYINKNLPCFLFNMRLLYYPEYKDITRIPGKNVEWGRQGIPVFYIWKEGIRVAS